MAQAKAARAAELVRVEQAKALGFTPAGEESFREVSRRFVVHQKGRLTPKEYERQKSIVSLHLDPFFAGLVASVRRAGVQRYASKRGGEVSAHTVRKEVNVLKHLLRLAVEWEVIPFSPAQGVKPPKVSNGRVRYLQPTELGALLEDTPSWLRPIVVLAVCTGMHRGEILSLRWLDVDLSAGRVMLPQTKNGDGRIVYLNDLAMAAVRSLGFRRPSDKLFPAITPDQVTVAFARLCRKVEIADFRFHDLRHTAASWLRMQGADIHTVAQLLGHKDLRMAARYQHLSPQFLSDAVRRLDAVFGAYVTPALPAPEHQVRRTG